MSEDFDVIVVGGGPAGLAAAARAVWLGTGERPYQASVLVLEASGELGGLSRWQPLQVAAPGFLFTKRELRKILSTCRALGVRFEHDEVVGVDVAPDGRKVVATARGGTYRGLALVLATGCRRSFAIEPRLFHEKRYRWFLSDDHLVSLFRELEETGAARRVCILGSSTVAATRAVLERAGSRLDLVLVAEPPYDGEAPAGTIGARAIDVRIGPDSNLVVRLARSGGEVAELDGIDVLFVDFDSYARRASSTGFLAGRPFVRPDGFVRAAPDSTVGAPGILAAGDVTGPPLSVAKALHEGAVAGFAAYAHVHAHRFGRPPDLFPYYPHPTTPSAD